MSSLRKEMYGENTVTHFLIEWESWIQELLLSHLNHALVGCFRIRGLSE